VIAAGVSSAAFSFASTVVLVCCSMTGAAASCWGRFLAFRSRPLEAAEEKTMALNGRPY